MHQLKASCSCGFRAGENQLKVNGVTVASTYSSAAPESLRTTAAGGHVAIILPFFSDVLLPEQRGKFDAIDNDAFEAHRVVPPSLKDVWVREGQDPS